MNSKLFILTKVDFIKTWGKGKIISIAAFCIISCVLSAVPAWFNLLGETKIPALQFTEYLLNIWKIIVPFAALFFTAGIISNEVKSHWLRTVMTHAVTRQDLLISKILSSTASVFVVMLLIGVIPLLVFGITTGAEFTGGILSIIQVFIYFILESALFVSIAIWLSCFMNGFLNIFFLAGWMFLDNVVIKGILSMWLSSSVTGNIITEFFFPSGFSEAAIVAGGSGVFPTEFLLWGFAALTFFITAGLFHINYVKIDVNTD